MIRDAVKKKRMTIDWMVTDKGLNNIDRNQGNGKEKVRRQEMGVYVGG